MTKFIKNIKERIDEVEEGFTLIELMVVVLIIGILMAIAIPTFLGAKNSANARAAQSNLRNSVTAEQSYFTDNQAYATGAQLATGKYETAIAYTDGTVVPTANGNAVQVDTATPTTTVQLSALGKDGNCYYVNDQNGQVAYLTDPGCKTSIATLPAVDYTKLAATSKNTVWGTTW